MNPDVDCLVILGSTTTALAIVRNCGNIGLRCVVIDAFEGPASRSRFPEVRVVDADDTETVLKTLLMCASHESCALIADSDAWLRWMTTHRDVLENAFAIILHPQATSLEICLNKTLFLEWCARNKLPAPRLFRSAEQVNTLERDCAVLVRPAATRHGQAADIPKATEVRDAAQFRQLMRQYSKLQVTATVSESLLSRSVKQYSVGVCRDWKGESRVLVAEKCRPSPRYCGGGTYVIAAPADDVKELARTVAVALDFFGIAEVEILKDIDSGELFLIEVNPRPWVQYSLAWRSGYDFITFLLNQKAYDRERERRVGKKWLSFWDDLYIALSRSEGMVTGGEIGFLSWVKTVFTANAFAYWQWSDPGPSISDVTARIARLIRPGKRN